jgi:hypothetical protein
LDAIIAYAHLILYQWSCDFVDYNDMPLVPSSLQMQDEAVLLSNVLSMIPRLMSVCAAPTPHLLAERWVAEYRRP